MHPSSNKKKMKGIQKLGKHSLGHPRCWRYPLPYLKSCLPCSLGLTIPPLFALLPIFFTEFTSVYTHLRETHAWKHSLSAETRLHFRVLVVCSTRKPCFNAALLLDNLPPHLTRAVSSLKCLPTLVFAPQNLPHTLCL